MKHPFQLERGGRQYFLVKHPNVRARLARGQISETQARATAWYFRLEKSPETGRPALLKVGEAEQAALAVEAAKLHLLKAREGANPYKKYRDAVQYRQTLTLEKLLRAYQAVSCPDVYGRPRQGTALAQYAHNIQNLLAYHWSGHNPQAITNSDRDAYYTWRCEKLTEPGAPRVRGARAVELELTTLNGALHWAWVRGDLLEQPRNTKTSYVRAEDITHARDAMPTSAEELHALARWFFARPDLAVYGWATLLGAFSGLRISELQALRANPKRLGVHVEPGWYDERCLTVYRRKRRGGKPVHDELALNDPTRGEIRPLLERIRRWHATFAQNPVLPGRRNSQQIDLESLLPMTPNTLTKQLQTAAAELNLPQRQAHGLRAYYVSTRLAAGIAPHQVAGEVGHLGSGDDLVRTVYGNQPPQWRGLENVYTWLPGNPDIKPAWANLAPAENIIKL